MALKRPDRIHGLVFLGPGFNALRAGKFSLEQFDNIKVVLVPLTV